MKASYMTVNTTCTYISNGFLDSFWITHDISEAGFVSPSSRSKCTYSYFVWTTKNHTLQVITSPEFHYQHHMVIIFEYL